jgi:hypothetical protein
MQSKQKIFHHFDQAYKRIYCHLYERNYVEECQRLPARLNKRIHNETCSVMRGKTNYPDDVVFSDFTEEVIVALNEKYDLTEEELENILSDYLDVAFEKSTRFIEDIKDREKQFESNLGANGPDAPTL